MDPLDLSLIVLGLLDEAEQAASQARRMNADGVPVFPAWLLWGG